MTDMMERTAAAPVVMHDGVPCAAPKHNSFQAYRQGCRSAAARAVHRRHRDGQEACKKRRVQRETWRIDPRLKWRGGVRGTKVDRNNLLMLLNGFPDSPTEQELRAAVIILSQRGNRAGTGLLDEGEIADRLGINRVKVWAIRRRVADLAARRAERRLADVKWKAQRIARAEEMRRRAEARDTSAHQGPRPRSIDHFRALRPVACRDCGRVIPKGGLHRVETRRFRDVEWSYQRTCAACALPLDGCGVCGVTPAKHSEAFGYVLPGAELVARRLRYRTLLADGVTPEDQQEIRDVWWRE